MEPKKITVIKTKSRNKGYEKLGEMREMEKGEVLIKGKKTSIILEE
jgi:hypothetical protein